MELGESQLWITPEDFGLTEIGEVDGQTTQAPKKLYGEHTGFQLDCGLGSCTWSLEDTKAWISALLC